MNLTQVEKRAISHMLDWLMIGLTCTKHAFAPFFPPTVFKCPHAFWSMASLCVLGHLNSKKCVLGAKLVVILTKMSHWGLVSVHLLQNWWIATASKFSLLKKISHQKIGKQKWMELDSWYLQGRFIRVIQWYLHKMVKIISLTLIEILVSHPLQLRPNNWETLRYGWVVNKCKIHQNMLSQNAQCLLIYCLTSLKRGQILILWKYS